MKREIPIFFTIDNAYAPFLAVALNSAVKNADPTRQYRAIVALSRFVPVRAMQRYQSVGRR